MIEWLNNGHAFFILVGVVVGLTGRALWDLVKRRGVCDCPCCEEEK